MRFVLVLAFVLPAACGGGSEVSAEVPPEVTGTITSIERSDRGPITSFTVRDDDGQAYVIRIDPSQDYGFDLEHLEEHRAQELPVHVAIERRGDDAFAVQILDA
jgi:hypothetical protein